MYKKIVSSMIVTFTVVITGCANTTHVQTGKQIMLIDEVSNPLIVTSYGAGVYEQIGLKGDYELYRPLAAETTNYAGSNNRYIGVKDIGKSSEVCIPDSMNFFWCTTARTKLIK